MDNGLWAQLEIHKPPDDSKNTHSHSSGLLIAFKYTPYKQQYIENDSGLDNNFLLNINNDCHYNTDEQQNLHDWIQKLDNSF